MFITRRIFTSGLAALLSVIRIPGVSVLEPMEMPEDEFDDYEYGPSIYYLEVGELEEMWGGPATKSGWYIQPVCNAVECCRPKGPFQSKEAALEADRISLDEVAGNGYKMEDISEEDLQFFS